MEKVKEPEGASPKIPKSDDNASEGYDPYANRKVLQPNTFLGALMHLLKSSLGTGILAIPSAVASAGLIVGSVGVLLIGLLCTHTVHLLVGASLKLCKKAKVPMLDFCKTAETVCLYGSPKIRPFARYAGLFVDISLLLTHYTGISVYVVFICTSIQLLVNYYHPEIENWPIHYYMLMLLLPLILSYQIRELKHLVPFSFVANTSMVVAFSITLYYIFAKIEKIKIENTKLFADISGLPLFFSTVLFAMEGIGTMLPIENSMLKPQFLGSCGVLNIAMFCVVTLYTVMGILGYLRFGDGINANIIAELPDEDVLAQVAKMCIAVAVFFTSMLQFYVPCDITWRRLAPLVPENYHNIFQICFRTSSAVFITVVAAAVPKLNSIIGLVGSIFFSTLGLFIPTVIDIILNSGEDGDFGFLKWKLWKNVLVLILWCFALFSGSYYAIKELAEG